MTDIELQKTNTTLRRLSEEMRSYSMEKSKEKEEELHVVEEGERTGSGGSGGEGGGGGPGIRGELDQLKHRLGEFSNAFWVFSVPV